MQIALDLSRSDVENLLTGFLKGAQNVELGARLTDLRELPVACRAHGQLAEASGGAWVGWSTPAGPVVAWGHVDVQGSRRLNAFLLLLNWCDMLSGHHSIWAYCDPKRPAEWTVGRGRNNEPR